MKGERLTTSGREREKPSYDLGKSFIDRWYVPEILSEQTKSRPFLQGVGETLKTLGESFPRTSDSFWPKKWTDRMSVLDLFALSRHSDQEPLYLDLWRKIDSTLQKEKLYYNVGDTVPIRQYDFLVTTPIAKAAEHVKEAEDSIQRFHETGQIDVYYRDVWPFPKNLRIGSKYFYVDNRAVRGFAVTTDIDIQTVDANMAVDTWRWIDPISCDYSRTQPPQRYAIAQNHAYFENTDAVTVVGNWLDPMPKLPHV